MDRIKAGEAYVEGTFDRTEIEKGLRVMQKRLQSTARAVSGIGKRLLLVGGGVLAAFAPAISAASDLEETMNKFNVVFGKNAKQVKRWGDDFAGEVGRSKQEVADFLAGTQDLLIPLGFEEGEATRLSKDITGLAVDLASFNNKVDADVVRDLHAALTGSGEVMKKYGVVVSEARVKQELLNQAIDPKRATEAQKAQARWNLILRGTTAAQGDAIRSADSYANQKKRLAAAIKDAAAELGGKLLPVVTPWVMWAARAAESAGEWVSQNEGLVQTIATVAAGVGGLGGLLTGLGLTLAAISSAVGGLTTLVGLGAAAWRFFTAGATEAGAATTVVTATATVASAAVAGLNRQLMVTRGLLPGLSGGMLALPGPITKASWAHTSLRAALVALRPAMAWLAANPVTAIFAGVAIIWGVVKAVRALTAESKSLNDELREQLELQAAAAAKDRERLKRLEELAEKEKLNATEMAEANKLLGELENRYGPLGAAVDETSQKLEGLAAAQERVNGAMKAGRLEELKGSLKKTNEKIAALTPTAELDLSGKSGRDRHTGGVRKSLARRQVAELQGLAADLRKQIHELEAGQAAPGGSTAGAKPKGGSDEMDRFEWLLEGVNANFADAREADRQAEEARREAERAAEEERRRRQQDADEASRQMDRQADAEMQVADDLAEARINATKKGLDRENALLDLRHQQEKRRLELEGLLPPELLAQMEERLKLQKQIAEQSSLGVADVDRNVASGTFNGRLASMMFGAEGDLPKRQLKEAEKQTVLFTEIRDHVQRFNDGIVLS